MIKELAVFVGEDDEDDNYDSGGDDTVHNARASKKTQVDTSLFSFTHSHLLIRLSIHPFVQSCYYLEY